jgi:molybdopterin biosynthesis enzyme
MNPFQSGQRVTRLTPLADVLASIDARVSAVTPTMMDVAAATGAALAKDVLALRTVPAVPLALVDGWALSSERVADASQYTPVALADAPNWADIGSPIGEADTIVAPSAVRLLGSGAEVYVAAAPGQGVLPAGGEVEAGELLRRSGERLRAIDVGLVRTAGVTKVQVRIPSIRIVIAAHNIDRSTDLIGPFTVRQVEAQGAVARLAYLEENDVRALERALFPPDADALIVIGGTGGGRRDHSVETLARLGRVEVHGIALSPGNTAAFGFLNACPVLLLPGGFDAALAALLTVGRRLLGRLSGATAAEPAQRLPIARKISSAIGVAEVVVVRRTGDELEPIARQFLSLRALARADGWVLVPPHSEGYAPGSMLDMLPLP